MACACQKGPNGETLQYVAVLPGGKVKKYNSQAARDAMVKMTPGAYSLPDPVVAS